MSDQRYTVLLVEDDVVDQMAFKRLIDRLELPYHLLIAGSMAEAVSCLDSKQIDLILLDYNLPDGNGLDIQQKAGDRPCIFITGTDDINVAIEAMKNGAYDFVIKDSRGDYLLLFPAVIEKAMARKRAEEQIRLQQQMINTLSEMVLLLDEKAVVIFANHALQNILGYSPREMVGTLWGRGIIEDEKESQNLRDGIVDRLQNGSQFEKDGKTYKYDLNLKCRSGKSIWTSWSESRYSANRVILVGHDITQRKEAEVSLEKAHADLESRIVERTAELGQSNQMLHREIEENLRTAQALRDSKRRFKMIFDKAADAIFIHDLYGNILDVNTSACDRLRYSYEDLLALNMRDILGDEQADFLEKNARELNTNGNFLYESVWNTSDGGTFLVEVHSQLIEFQGVPALLCTSRDITERKAAEKALIRSEEKYRALVENLSEVIFILDANYSFTFVSPVIKQIAGYSPEEMAGNNFTKYVHPEDIRKVDHYFCYAVMRNRDSITLRLLARDGSIRYVRCSSRTLYEDGQIIGWTGILSDYTEQKMTQDALMESQKLADIGILTGGVMHDIKSPLQVITGISDTLGSRIMNNEVDLNRAVELLENINRNAWRINAIANSLLNYARFSSGEIEPHHINEIVKDTLLLIEHQLSTWSSITVETRMSQEMPMFDCDRNKITQVLINLLTNARDAMPEGGKITISTGMDKPGHMFLSVADTGEGIPDELKDKIFNTFFTTKPTGRGTGLGLTIIKDIVQSHNGTIEFESQEKSGTTFILQFPIKKQNV